jgi:hypothetical protein
MLNTSLKQLPSIIDKVCQQAKFILEYIQSNPVRLEVREWVLPVNDSARSDWVEAGERRKANQQPEAEPNWLIEGDSLLAIAALLKGGERMASLQGKIGLIYIDLRVVCHLDHQHEATSFGYVMSTAGRHAYFDGEEDRIVYDLEMVMLRLLLMQRLLSDGGTICIWLPVHLTQAIKAMMDQVLRYDGMVILQWLPDLILFAREETAQRLHHQWMPAGLSSAQQDRHPDSQESMREVLLEKIILDVTDSQSIVADFFAGCGNTALVAERLGRHWIISDAEQSVCMRLRRQLRAGNVEPFIYQAVSDSESHASQLYWDADITDIVFEPKW